MSSIDKKTNLTPDIYGINSYVNEIKKRFTPDVDEDTSLLGIFGYTGQLFSDLLQNTIVMSSEFSNESIPTKAKFEKNIIAHALGLGISDINAVPAQFDVLLTFVEEDIENWWDSNNLNGKEDEWTFIFDKDQPIYVGEHCFHTDYDIQINKIKIDNSGSSNDFTYTAKYIINDEKNNHENPISSITNPYLTSPVRMYSNGKHFLFTKCTLHQVTKTTQYKKVLSDNSITSKTLTFEFEGQLASFTIDAFEANSKQPIHLIPVYDGLSVPGGKYQYFYYSYLDSNTIRIKFDRLSYLPRTNCDININIQTTEGENGNFIYESEVYPSIICESTKYGYNNITCEIRPITGESAYGADKKSIEDLKKLIPKEALSRGSITNITDLENFFNMINTEDSKMYFYKKRDNALERLYYSFMIMRDAYNVIIPTNTINLKIPTSSEELKGEGGSGKLVFSKGQVIDLELKNDSDNYGVLGKDDDNWLESNGYNNTFKYVIPYNFVINKDPLYGMYFLSIIDEKKFLDFSYINEKSLYQYIATSLSIYRGYTEAYNPNTYEMSILLEQNMDTKLNDNIEPRCVAVFYDDEDKPYVWAEGEKIDRNEQDKSANIFNFKFKFETNDIIDSKNKIRIEGVKVLAKDLNPESDQDDTYGYMSANTKCIIHILYEAPGGDIYTNGDKDIEVRKELEGIISNMDGYTLSNSYTVLNGVDFFYDYSDIISSTVLTEKDEKDQEYFIIKNVPVVKYGYFDSEDKATDFCKELVKRKNYIDYAIQILEDAFGMDFKFFNTYGPSNLFKIDGDEKDELAPIDRTNLSLTFNVKLAPNYDTNIINNIIADVKEYIEDINEISSLHMSNLVTEITDKYRESLIFFEFADMNGYGPGKQHIYSTDMSDNLTVPEFLNITSRKDGTPDITLVMK